MLKAICKTGFIAGTLDILAAIFILAKGNAMGTLKFVASGYFGKDAIAGGNEMAAWGLLFHYIIAFCFTSLYFIVYPKIKLLHKHVWINAIIYGIIVWLTMAFIVVPNSAVAQRPFNPISAIKNCTILIVCIALPIAYFTHKFYANRKGAEV